MLKSLAGQEFWEWGCPYHSDIVSVKLIGLEHKNKTSFSNPQLIFSQVFLLMRYPYSLLSESLEHANNIVTS